MPFPTPTFDDAHSIGPSISVAPPLPSPTVAPSPTATPTPSPTETPEADEEPEPDGHALADRVAAADRHADALTALIDQIAGAASSDSSNGINAVMTVPRPGLERRLNVPLASSTRSRIEASPTRPARRYSRARAVSNP